MTNYINQKPVDIKLIGSYDEKLNRIDFAMPIKMYEEEQYKDCKVPELDCFKKYDFMQVPLDNLQIPEHDRRFINSLNQNDVITFKATFVNKVSNDEFDIDNMVSDFEYIKIWNLKKYNKPKAFERLAKVGRYKKFQYHYIVRPGMKKLLTETWPQIKNIDLSK